MIMDRRDPQATPPLVALPPQYSLWLMGLAERPLAVAQRRIATTLFWRQHIART
jgi:hypothetical protein